jgi:hypothetical protein
VIKLPQGFGVRALCAAFTFALLVATSLTNSGAAAYPLVLQAGVTNTVSLPPDTRSIWLNFEEGGRNNSKDGQIKITAVGSGKSAVVIPSWFVGTPNGKLWVLKGGPIAACRWLTGDRFSSIQPILIDTLPIKTNLSLPAGIIGTIKESESIRLPFTMDSHAEMRFEIVANRIGSQLDPVLKILDGRGRVITASDDNLFAGRDCQIEFGANFKSFDLSVERKRKYVLQISDIGSKGGEDYFFYVRAGWPMRPSGDVLFPPGLGWIQTEHPAAITHDDEPNDTPATAKFLKIPCSTRGEFRPHKNYGSNSILKKDDRDWFQFEAKANQRLIFSAETRRFGSPCDAGISLFGEDGKRMAESVGIGSEGASITNRFEKTGTYRIEIREISRLTGNGLDYWLKVEDFKPGVMLTTEVERLDFGKDGEATIKIDCKRYEYDGPIKIFAEGLPEGVTVFEATIPEKKNEGLLKLKRERAVSAFQIRIKGRIDEAKNADAFEVSTMPALRKLYPLQLFPCAAMDGWIAVNPPSE